jgi:3-methylcrotonyl-CoA carboxylase alpha subunit
MEHIFEFDGNVFNLSTTRTEEGVTVEYQGASIPVRIREVGEGMYVLSIEGRSVKVIVDGDDRTKHVFCKGDVFQFNKVAPGAAEAHKELSGDLEAPLTGRVIQIMVGEGDEVDEKTPIMIIEAMKMEHKIRSPFKGRIGAIDVSEGEMVDGGRIVAKVEKEEE